MAESDFSWFKIASFFGAGLLALVCFVAISSGIFLITNGMSFNGAVTVAAGLLCGVGAALIYRNYQKKNLKK